MHVLFVCSGNVCRSAIAERLTRAYAAEHGIDTLTAESAGTRALVGFPIEPMAQRVIEGLGGDAADFKARKLKAEHIKNADLILTMTEALREDTMRLVPGILHSTFTLLEAHRIATAVDATSIGDLAVARHKLTPDDRENISDPVGLSEAAFVAVGDRIADALLPLLTTLCPPAVADTSVPPRLPQRKPAGGNVIPFRRPEVRSGAPAYATASARMPWRSG